jgi:hypothetical protein
MRCAELRCVDSAESRRVTPAVAFDVAKAPAFAQLDGAVAQLLDRLTQPASATRRVFNWALRGEDRVRGVTERANLRHALK